MGIFIDFLLAVRSFYKLTVCFLKTFIANLGLFFSFLVGGGGVFFIQFSVGSYKDKE